MLKVGTKVLIVEGPHEGTEGVFIKKYPQLGYQYLVKLPAGYVSYDEHELRAVQA